MNSEINFYCRVCGNGFLLENPPFPEQSRCEKCKIDYPLDMSNVPKDGESLEVCPRCAGKEFYIQKDFNRNLGLAVTIIAGGVTYSVFGLTWKSLVGLLVIAALDAALYRVLPLITICYSCKTIFRGFTLNPKHAAFDLHTAEQYRRSG